MPPDGLIKHYPEDAVRSKPDRFLVVLATTTKEKVIQYQLVARKMGLPIQFRGLNELIDVFHAAEEDTGDRVANGKQKFAEAEFAARVFYDPKSTYYRLLQEKCLEWNVDFHPARIFLASDDATFEVRSDVWKLFRKKLRQFVPDQLLKVQNAKGEMTGPGAETGPILAAVTVERFVELFRQSALEVCVKARCAGNETSPASPEISAIRNGRTLTVRNLLEAQSGLGAPVPISWDCPLYLHAPLGLDKPLEPPNAPFVTIDHYFKAKKNVTQPIAQSLADYLVYDSPTRKVVLQFYKIALSYASDTRVHRPLDKHGRRKAKKSGQKFKIVSPSLVPKHLESVRSLNELLDISNEFRNADVIEFNTFDATDPAARVRNYYKLFSAVVAKQLDARFMGVPIIVHDDSCWKPAIDMLKTLCNDGMSKDFLLSAYEGGALVSGTGLTHTATAFIDHIESKDATARCAAAEHIKDIRRSNYSRFRYSKHGAPDTSDLHYMEAPVGNSLTPKPPGLFAVGICTSASNDNRKLITTVAKYTKFLQKNLGAGVVWGAGDRHAMGAVIEGILEAVNGVRDRITWLAGFTTRPIAETETRYGKPPIICHWPKRYNENIYTRMADIIESSDMIVLAPGGPGTVQEKLAVLQTVLLAPHLLRNKKIVFYLPDIHANNRNTERRFWEMSIKSILGKAVWERLQESHESGMVKGKNDTKSYDPARHSGIDNMYIIDKLDDLKALTRRFKYEHDRHYALTRSRNADHPGQLAA
ncbi:MAG: hypothetical protein AB7H77_10330 [Bdellovibrionales bacterium]